jgi:hypothetical protein
VAKRAPGGSRRWPGRPLADRAIHVGLVALRLILKRAARDGQIPLSPFTHLEWRGSPRVDRIDPFTGAELRAVLASARLVDADFAVMLHLWAQCGARAGEICGLHWDDLDLARGLVTIRRTTAATAWDRPRQAVSARLAFSIPCSTMCPNGARARPSSADPFSVRSTSAPSAPRARSSSRTPASRSALAASIACGTACSPWPVCAIGSPSSSATRWPRRSCPARPPSSTSSRSAAGARPTSFSAPMPVGSPM